ncbi:MAG: membrane dipeptidase [Bianqueaceae bacterium]
MAALLRHARHLANVGGIDCVAIGSDFDGISGNLKSRASRYAHSAGAIGFSRFTSSDIDKIALRM